MSRQRQTDKRQKELIRHLLESDSDVSSLESDSDVDARDVEPSSESDSIGTDDDDDDDQSTSQVGVTGNAPFDVSSLQWNDDPTVAPTIPPFTGNTGLLFDPADMQPIDFFMQYVDMDLICHMVYQTNLYARQFFRDNGGALGAQSRCRQWKETNTEEMKRFIGLTLLMGVVRKPKIASYWSTDFTMNTPVFPGVMKRNRYQLMLRFWHLNDNDRCPPPDSPNTDRLYKIRPVVDHLFEKFQTTYAVGREVSVDESLLLWKGRLSFKQYLPLKRSRFGIKLYKLCESETGYVYRFFVYVGKLSSPITCPPSHAPPPDFGATETIVWYLTMPLFDAGHCLYVDNFYTSLPLFRALYARRTLACGTIRSNRKGYPKSLIQHKLSVVGQSTALRAKELLALKFRDKKEVYMLTTAHNSACTTVTVHRKDMQTMDKPDCILNYNRKMGGVDRSDQLIQPYDCTRKSKIWYKKLCLHLLQLALLNAHIVYKQSSAEAKLSFLDFSNEVIAELLKASTDDDESELDTVPHENVLRLTGRHYPMKIPLGPQQTKVMKRCKVCHKKKIRRESRYTCDQCPSKPGLCVDTCFRLYHSKRKYWK